MTKKIFLWINSRGFWIKNKFGLMLSKMKSEIQLELAQIGQNRYVFIFKNCLGIIRSVSMLIILSGTATPVSVVNLSKISLLTNNYTTKTNPANRLTGLSLGQFSNIGNMTGYCSSSGHGGTHKMSTPTSTLTSFKISV